MLSTVSGRDVRVPGPLTPRIAGVLVGAGCLSEPGHRHTRAAASLGARFVQIDVTDDASVAAAIRTIEAVEGRLDVLINNAGISGGEEADGPDALRVFDTNVVGVIRVTQAALPLLRRSANPVVVNLSSALGSFWAVRNPDRPASQVSVVHAYGASKAAVSMLTVQYAKAVPEIKFNTVKPGYTATDLTGGGGRPVAESTEAVVRMATIGADGPTGTFQEDEGELAW